MYFPWPIISMKLLARCRVNVIGLLFLATVFIGAFTFNGDLIQWDVAKVTDMSQSKSIRMLENDLA